MATTSEPASELPLSQDGRAAARLRWTARIIPSLLLLAIIAVEPAFAAVFGYLLAGDRLGAVLLVGACVMVAAMLAIHICSASAAAKHDAGDQAGGGPAAGRAKRSIAGVAMLAAVLCGALPLWASRPSGEAGQVGEARKYADPPMPVYRVDPEGFEGASARDIKAVCDSSGRELWRHFPDYKVGPFVVVRDRKTPQVLFRRNNRGEIILRLDTGGTYWCQYAYQFAHEFCHILCGFDEDYRGNLWFEEMLCETASLFTLRAMAEAWEKDPPYRHWADYRHSLRKYADKVIAGRQKIDLPLNGGLKAFYEENRQQLEKRADARDLNGAMAVVLLGLFEAQPARWEAVRWLNSSPSPKGETFGQYLRKWRDAAPPRHRPFIERIATLYGVELPKSPATAPADPPPPMRPAFVGKPTSRFHASYVQ